MQPLAPLHSALLAQRGRLFEWVPVCLAIGIGLYLSLRWEPSAAEWALLGGCGLGLLGSAWLVGAALRPLPIALALVLAGAGLAAVRTHDVAAPVLGFRYYGPVEGRIVQVDRSASDAVRLTLDRVVLEDMIPDRTPAQVRISLHGDQRWMVPEPGLTVMTTGHLAPPAGPAEPGGFDFRRHAWFERLGAVGYTRNPVLIRAPPEEGSALWLHRLRARLSAAVQDRIGGDAGGFAAAVTTGDRSGLSRAASDAMRDANLYHLVSISGMHMGMLAAFVFAAVRYAVALIPPLALRVSSKKIAAAVALPVAAFYLALAGRAVPTERAFVMVAVMLVAILLDRRAFTLRSVALAACVVLVLRPESLVSAGFQMSFAAAVALVWLFGGLGHWTRGWSGRAGRWRLLAPVATLALSSLIAGTATAPFAAAHFNRLALYGLLANLLAVPAMGLLVMPGAVILALTAPLGLDWPAVWMMEAGGRWILSVAGTVAGLDGAVRHVVAPPPAVLPLLSLGGAVLVLWRGHGRWAGAAALAMALLLWARVERPVLLVADGGALLGVAAPEGRALSSPRGESWVAEQWLANDGSLRTQEQAFALFPPQEDERRVALERGGVRVLQVRGKTALAALEGCGGADLLILTIVDEAERPCAVWDLARFRRTGALAIVATEEGLRLQTAAEIAGRRPWTGGRVPENEAPLIFQ